MMMHEILEQYWSHTSAMILMAAMQPLVVVGRLLLDCYQRGSTLFVLGNGGSASTASHFACDLAKGTLTPGAAAYRVVALTDNNALLTAWANDTSYERVFAEQLAALARPGDLVMAISTSGNSPNVLAAVQTARALGLTTIALTGADGGRLRSLADVTVTTAAGTTEQVEDLHLMMTHSLCVALRAALAEAAAAPLLVERDVIASVLVG
jgi:D-sedoheptulose 7-phosphate isomerase